MRPGIWTGFNWNACRAQAFTLQLKHSNWSAPMPTPSGHTTAIRASRTIGTSVYNTQGDKIGKVEDVVLDKTNNSIMFAVVSFGGFLGMGEKFHPVPWSALDYSKDQDGYVIPYTKEQLEAAPADAIDDLTHNDGTAMRDSAYSHYKVQPYWK